MIIVEQVSKYYGSFAAVSNLSFSIAKGDIVGLLGLNGAGKTTTLRILSGLLFPTSGRVFFDGIEMTEHPEHLRARIGFLPEIPPLYSEMTVYDFVMFVAHIKGLQTSISKAVDRVLEETELTAVKNQVIATLSHGFKKRVGIAQALVHSPELILLDEPTSGLDPVQVVHMRHLLQNLRTRHTVVISSHVLSEIQQVCDKLIVLRQGQVVKEGSEHDLKRFQVRIEVRALEIELSDLLTSLSFVEHFIVESSEQHIIKVKVELKTDVREALAQAIVTKGLGLLKLEPLNDLENIFLKLIENKSAA